MGSGCLTREGTLCSGNSHSPPSCERVVLATKLTFGDGTTSYRKSAGANVLDNVPPCFLLAAESGFSRCRKSETTVSHLAQACWGTQAVKSPRQGAIGRHTLGHGYVAQAGKKWSSVTCCNQLLIASGVVIKISSLRWWVKVLSASECLVSWAGAANEYARITPEDRAG